MIVFSYRSDAPNAGLFLKTGSSKPSFQVDFTDGLASSAVLLSAVTVGAVNVSNIDVTTSVVSGATTSGGIVTVALLTAGTSGTQAAIDGTQYRIRTTVTASDGRVLAYDNFLYVDNPAFTPGGL